MINYREIIQLKSQNHKTAHIASSVGSSRNTVTEVWSLCQVRLLSWETAIGLTNQEIQKVLYPAKEQSFTRNYPNYEFIHVELAKPGVTLTLLWSEYCIQSNNEHLIPYQYTQFCDNYHAFVSKTKATL